MIGLEDYNKCSEEEVKKNIIDSYYANPNLVNKFEILVASGCGDGGYEEWSFFLLRDKETNKLYENHASHCSCDGYEGQFDPKETTLAYLKSDKFHAISSNVNEAVKKLVATL